MHSHKRMRIQTGNTGILFTFVQTQVHNVEVETRDLKVSRGPCENDAADQNESLKRCNQPERSYNKAKPDSYI